MKDLPKALTPGEMEAMANVASIILGPQAAVYGTEPLLKQAANAIIHLNREARRVRELAGTSEVIRATGLLEEIEAAADVDAEQKAADRTSVVLLFADRLEAIIGLPVTEDQARERLSGGPVTRPKAADRFQLSKRG